MGSGESLAKIEGFNSLIGLGAGFTESATGRTAVRELAKTLYGAPSSAYTWPTTWPWNFNPLVRFDLEATGAFSIHSHSLHAFLQGHPETLVVPADLVNALEEIDALKDLPAGWNGYGAAAPNPTAVRKAKSLLEHICEDAIATSGTWFAPSIIADAFGNVVFEWWEDGRKLTVYVTPTVAEYVKVWGPDMFSDMEDGDIEGAEDRRALWRWLVG